jgi:translation initiation factor IF-3
VRLISEDGKQLGIVPLKQALEIAKEEGLDLVEVAPNANPPVCRIMDYGKFKYQTTKKLQEAKKKHHQPQLKEVKLRPNTDEHDLNIKIKNIKKFLEKKDRVKVTVFFKGREIVHFDRGLEMMKKIAAEVSELGHVEKPPSKEASNRLMMIITPK